MAPFCTRPRGRPASPRPRRRGGIAPGTSKPVEHVTPAPLRAGWTPRTLPCMRMSSATVTRDSSFLRAPNTYSAYEVSSGPSPSSVAASTRVRRSTHAIPGTCLPQGCESGQRRSQMRPVLSTSTWSRFTASAGPAWIMSSCRRPMASPMNWGMTRHDSPRRPAFSMLIIAAVGWV